MIERRDINTYLWGNLPWQDIFRETSLGKTSLEKPLIIETTHREGYKNSFGDKASSLDIRISSLSKNGIS